MYGAYSNPANEPDFTEQYLKLRSIKTKHCQYFGRSPFSNALFVVLYPPRFSSSLCVTARVTDYDLLCLFSLLGRQPFFLHALLHY